MAIELLADASQYLLVFAFTLIITLTAYQWFKTRNYPPGPRGLPVLGYAPFLGKKPNVVLKQLGQKYGDIFSFYIGPQLVVCITEYQLAKEILNNPITLTRPLQSFAFLTGNGGFGGLNGEEWQEQRRYAIQTMRNLGLGKGIWETMIQEVASDFTEEVKSWNGKATCIEGPLTALQATSSISLLIGRHLDKNEDAEDIQVITKLTRDLMDYFSAVGIAVALPWLANIMRVLRLGKHHKMISLLRRFESIFKKEVTKRINSKDALTRDDFIGCYLQEMEKRKNDPNNSFTIDRLCGNMFILFVAGNDTTMASISWLLLIMAKYPEIQKKIHEEIDATIGRDGVVYYEDRGKLPYTVATTMEMTRWISISAVFPPRYPMQSFEFHGYTIPQYAFILTNIWAIMRDPRYIKDPEAFRPERFLSEDRKTIIKLDSFAPFSIGKRNCPGDGIAMMTMYLFFVSIMQKFEVRKAPGKEINMDYVFGGAVLPIPQELCFVQR